MSDNGTITINADEYLKLIDRLRDLETELRKLGHGGFNISGKTTPASPSRREKKEEAAAMEVDLDILEIEWQTKDKQPAGPEAVWCWAFSTTRDGGIRRECIELVRAIELYGTVKIGQYEIGLSGREGNLLNRRKVT